MICTRHVTAADQPTWLGEPCPDCGHTTLGHPGITNLTLDACLICEVQATVQQLRELVDGIDRVTLGQHQELVALQARVQQLEEPSMMGEGQ